MVKKRLPKRTAAHRRIRIGVSSCLLGEAVRYDGGDKRDAYVAAALARRFELVPVCPEVGIGLGVPRPPIHLVGVGGVTRAVGRDDPSLDVTVRLAAYARRQARRLDDVSGYIFKSRSPSCGLHAPLRVAGRWRRGRGVYADAFLALHPGLPAEEEDRLANPALRDNFLERVFAYRGWQELRARGLTGARLAEFHESHRRQLMAHATRAERALASLVRRVPHGRLGPRVAAEYLVVFMAALARPATTARLAKG